MATVSSHSYLLTIRSDSTGAAEVAFGATKTVSSWADASYTQQCGTYEYDHNEFTAVQDAFEVVPTVSDQPYPSVRGVACPPQWLPLLLASMVTESLSPAEENRAVLLEAYRALSQALVPGGNGAEAFSAAFEKFLATSTLDCSGYPSEAFFGFDVEPTFELRGASFARCTGSAVPQLAAPTVGISLTALEFVVLVGSTSGEVIGTLNNLTLHRPGEKPAALTFWRKWTFDKSHRITGFADYAPWAQWNLEAAKRSMKLGDMLEEHKIGNTKTSNTDPKASTYEVETLRAIAHEHDALYEPVLQVCSSGRGSAEIAKFSHPFLLHNVTRDKCWQAFGSWTKGFDQSFNLNKSLELAAPSLGSNGRVVIIPIIVHMKSILDASGRPVPGTEIPTLPVYAKYTFNSVGKISGYEQFYDTLALETSFQTAAGSRFYTLPFSVVLSLGFFALFVTVCALALCRANARPPSGLDVKILQEQDYVVMHSTVAQDH